MDVSLSADVLDQLNTEEARALHNLSDSLSSCGVGRIVNLPQIIVVGEQSSGKSSVLEAISHVRFPVEGGVCTRFATELVLRQANETRVNVSVKFSDRSKAPKTFQRTGFREHDLPDIIKEAKESMGFARAGNAFSKDILRLEIQGPKMYPLSLVDLPGLFHTRTETQSLEDKKIVDELVDSYMQQKNSIILVVISANNQLASQAALTKVKDIDPLGQRTIGVITKPDLTQAESNDQRMYIRVAKNQESANKLQLGWHVLRNRAENETTSLKDRDENEDKYFRTGAWASIPGNDRGIHTLRLKLSTILYNHVRNSLPGVIEDIERNLRERQEQFDQLGDPRSTPGERRSFLLSIADKFQRLARDGIDGRYKDPFFGDLEDGAFKIRAQLRNFTRAFDHILKTKGSRQEIIPNYEDEVEEDYIPEYLQNLIEQYHYDFPYPTFVTREELNAQLQKQAATNQGREFPGSPNQDLAIQLFKEEAAPWKGIAEFHISCVTLVVKAFVDELFKHIVGSPETNGTTEAILSTCVDPFFEDKATLLREKLQELLRPYVEGYATPLDSDFYDTLSRKSKDRFTARFCEIMKDEYPELFKKDSKKRLSPEMVDRVLSADESLQDGEFGTDKVIDMMMMSRRTFTDNVVNLAIESCLVCHIPDILTPTKVDRMSDVRLQELAAESAGTISRRQTLKEEIDVLRDGLARLLPPSVAKAGNPVPKPSAATGARDVPTKPVVIPPGQSTPTPGSTSARAASSTPLVPVNPTPKPAASPKPTNRTPSLFDKTATFPSGGLFSKGSQATPPQTKPSGLFSQTNTAAPQTTAGGTSGGLFGQPQTTVPQSKPGTSSVGFGQPQTTVPQTKPGTSSVGFGQQQTTTPQAKSAGLFSQPNTAAPQTKAGGASVGIFGQSQTTAPQSKPSLFGSSAGNSASSHV
ncbi:hypothetical protein G7Z17_g1042 [Cylindrodendrum hubeiense]|uniref:Dynamin family protein n=1 Tax=Cylindrodendrum hubeiense TaxID=595255 RepID=A0A9P5LKH7_9HYPO|nr:hypothetical protein G7Z17_g1042 [Cylindrodendrum hubeiense]